MDAQIASLNMRGENVSDGVENSRRSEGGLFEYIEVWYNRERRHSTLDYYLSPAEYEEKRFRNVA